MNDLHVIAMLPPAKKDRAKYLASILASAKSRWNWRVSVLCDGIERATYADLIEPGGETIDKPHLLKKADWEKDPAEVANTEVMFREAERAAGLGAGRIILAAGHSIGRGYNWPVRHVRYYALVRRVLRDNTEAERITRRLFRFANDILEKHKPDLIYAFEWSTPLNLCVWFAAQRQGIPCVALRYSKIIPGHAYWTTDPKMLNTLSIALAGEKAASEWRVSNRAHKLISEFRNQPRVISYIAERWKNRSRRDFIRWHAQYARIVVREFINTFRGQDLSLREPPLTRFIRYYHSLYLSAAHQKFFTALDDQELAGAKYVYFPLHKEAELAQTFQAPAWHDQRNTVRVLASLMPAGYRLLVREHRMNLGLRPTRSYKQYAALPNVTLIDPYDSQFKYLKHASLVVTENGSSGWEGLLMGKRVITLAQTFYDGASLGTKVFRPDELNRVILDTLAAPEVEDPSVHDYTISCAIDSEYQCSFPSSPEGIRAGLDLLMKVVDGLLKQRSSDRTKAA